MKLIQTLLSLMFLITFFGAAHAESSGTVVLMLGDQTVDMVVDPAESALFSSGDPGTAPVIEIIAHAPEDGDAAGAEIRMRFDVVGVIPTPEVNIEVPAGPAAGSYYLESDWRKALFSTDAFGRDGDNVVLEGTLTGDIDRVGGTSGSQSGGVPVQALVKAILEQRTR